MSANENNLIWIDLEMTGLDPERDRIIEIATLVTDANLNILAEGPTIAVHQSDEQLALMDDWNVRTHTASGLVERVKAILGDQVKDVRISDRLAGSPALLASEDGVSSSMEKFMRVMQKDDSIPKKILELNPDHPLLRALLRIYKANAEDPLVESITRTLYDNTLLLDGYLNDPYAMAERSLKLMGEAAGWYADLRKL